MFERLEQKNKIYFHGWRKQILRIAALLIVLFVVSVLFSAPTRKLSFPPLQKISYVPDPSVSAYSILITRLASGEILYQKNADEKRSIASLTKLMTGVLLFEGIDPFALISFTDSAKKLSGPAAKKSEVPAGEKIKAEDAAKLLLVESDNDAAFAIADASTSVANFVSAMNQKAAALGMAKTHFANPAGIDDPQNYSTAFDLQKLVRYAYEKHSDLWSVTRIAAGEIIGVSDRQYHFSATNELLKEMPDKIYGGKTGFTDEAQGALILLYRPVPAETVSIVILGSADRFQDARNLIQWLQTAFVWHT